MIHETPFYCTGNILVILSTTQTCCPRWYKGHLQPRVTFAIHPIKGLKGRFIISQAECLGYKYNKTFEAESPSHIDGRRTIIIKQTSPDQ